MLHYRRPSLVWLRLMSTGTSVSKQLQVLPSTHVKEYESHPPMQTEIHHSWPKLVAMLEKNNAFA